MLVEVLTGGCWSSCPERGAQPALAKNLPKISDKTTYSDLGSTAKRVRKCLNRKCALYIYLPRFARKPRRRGLRGGYLSGIL